MKKHYYHEAILNVCHGNHLTIDEIYFALKKKYPRIGIATVYRNMKLLTEQGKLSKISGIGSSDKYETNEGSHIHVINSETGMIEDINLPEGLKKELSRLTNQDIDKIEINLYVSKN